MKEQTNLGTLGKVLEILRSEGIVDIPEVIDPVELSVIITLEMSLEKTVELLNVIEDSNRKDYTDEEAMAILENFFTNMGEKLEIFVRTLTREFNMQKDLAIERANKTIDAMITKAITSETASDFLQSTDFPKE